MKKAAYAKGFSSGPQKTWAPRTAPGDSEDKRPVWRLQTLDWAGPFACCEISAMDLRRVIDRLAALETMTWHEIEGKENHFISVASLAADARDRLRELRQDDTDQVFSIRVTARQRIIGIRDRWILKLLWWDPEHAVCPSHKKHT